MKVDKWFEEQSLLVRIILLFIPFVGWVVEVLVRISALLRTKSKMNIIGLAVFAVLGGAWVLCLCDALFLYFKDRLVFYE